MDFKPQPQFKKPRKKEAPYRKEKGKTCERVSALQGEALDFVSATETPDNEEQTRRLVRSEVMKNFHAKRREAVSNALKEGQKISIEKSSVICGGVILL